MTKNMYIYIFLIQFHAYRSLKILHTGPLSLGFQCMINKSLPPVYSNQSEPDEKF